MTERLVEHGGLDLLLHDEVSPDEMSTVNVGRPLDLDFRRGFADGSLRMRHRATYGSAGIASIESLPSDESAYELGVLARTEYESFIGSRPKHLKDVPANAVQLGPNGKAAIPEEQVEAFLDNIH
jgi:hypothetical protein